jgi:hypothetical protein
MLISGRYSYPFGSFGDGTEEYSFRSNCPKHGFF